MSEFKMPEINEIKKPEPEGFKDIKPQQEINPENVKNFWNNEFKDNKDNSYSQDSLGDSPKEYYDDNGQKYREGDNLEPNNEIEKNGFKFKTDESGRVISAEGKLKIPEELESRKTMPSREKVGKGDERPSDERFHLIARMFGGGNGIENLVAGDAELNHGDYLKMENMLKEALDDGADVRMKVEPVYNGDSNRPSEFRVSYSINGERDTVVFKNGRGD